MCILSPPSLPGTLNWLLSQYETCSIGNHRAVHRYYELSSLNVSIYFFIHSLDFDKTITSFKAQLTKLLVYDDSCWSKKQSLWWYLIFHVKRIFILDSCKEKTLYGSPYLILQSHSLMVFLNRKSFRIFCHRLV